MTVQECTSCKKVTDYSKKPWLITKLEKCFVSIICDYSLPSVALIRREASLKVFTVPNLKVRLSSLTSFHMFCCSLFPIGGTFGCSLNSRPVIQKSYCKRTEEHLCHFLKVNIILIIYIMYIIIQSQHPVTRLVTAFPKCPRDIWWTTC